MKRIQLSAGVTRIEFDIEDTALSEAVLFVDGNTEYLRQTDCRFSPRPVYAYDEATAQGTAKQTANGEVTVFESIEKRFVRESRSVELHFAYPRHQLLTGLGQHEDGIYDYSEQRELMYQHNMKISIPFVLSSDGYGLLIEADCAMRFAGEKLGFHFALDAADRFSYVVFRGCDCADVLRKLTLYIGPAAMLPKWVFGYIQSKERYQSAQELQAVTEEFRQRGLGLDCIVLDWLSWQDGCWGDKVPDPERFPNVLSLTETLRRSHVHLMVSIWPNMSKGDDHDAFERQHMFLPGTNIYDAFSSEARDLYWQQCRKYWMDGGVDALWCDSCEPVTDPDWCGKKKRTLEERCRLITQAAELSIDPTQLNAYGRFHCEGLSKHWREDYPNKRVAILTRSGSIGSSAEGVVLWSGDVCAKWEVLRNQITEGIKIASCGISYWTLDIGAFFVGQKQMWFWAGDYPGGVSDPAYRELYVRWFQYGCMLPLFRSHGTDTPREPWQFGDAESAEYAILRDVIRLRYRLLPYLYATAAQACREGLPMIRSLLTMFGGDEHARALSDSYMLGDALLIKPVTRALVDGGVRTQVYLPMGAQWYDLFTLNGYEGGCEITMETPLERFPLLIRAGSILPVANHAESVEDLPFCARELWVFCGSDGAFDLYDDEGDGYGYEQGAYAVIPMRYEEKTRTLCLGCKQGAMPVDFDILVRFIHADGSQSLGSLRYAGGETSLRCPDTITEVSEPLIDIYPR